MGCLSGQGVEAYRGDDFEFVHPEDVSSQPAHFVIGLLFFQWLCIWGLRRDAQVG